PRLEGVRSGLEGGRVQVDHLAGEVALEAGAEVGVRHVDVDLSGSLPKHAAEAIVVPFELVSHDALPPLVSAARWTLLVHRKVGNHKPPPRAVGGWRVPGPSDRPAPN